MEALWRSWDHLRLDPPLGEKQLVLNHADPHVRRCWHSFDSGDCSTR
ncbi:DUF4913 domain-containing protein [Pseudarthrobacter sp. NPDC055928]